MIDKFGCHYFWPGLLALLKNTPTFCEGDSHYLDKPLFLTQNFVGERTINKIKEKHLAGKRTRETKKKGSKSPNKLCYTQWPCH
jgi:hypothetical protein